MAEIESELREVMRDAVADAEPSRDVMTLVRKKHRRWKFQVATASAAAVAIIVALVPAVASISGGSGRSTSGLASPGTSVKHRPSVSPPPPGWVRHTDAPGANADYIDTPASWHVNNKSPTMDPSVLWVIGTGSVPGGGNCGPTAALRKLPSNGVLFDVMEYSSPNGEPYTFPPRTGHLGIGPLGSPTECWGVKTHIEVFEDAGRYFQVQAAFGPKASTSLRDEVRQSLNTLHIARYPGTRQPAAQCRAGAWTYCPQAAWIYEMINKAGVFHLGHQGTHAILGMAGKRTFAAWTTPLRMHLSQHHCRRISGVNVCRDGNRQVWPVDGLLVWLKPGLPTGATLTRLVEASQSIPVP